MFYSNFHRHSKLILCTYIISCNQLIVSCSFVFSSLILARLKEPTSTISIDDEDASWIASVPVLVCPVGLIILGIISDKYGRRKAIQIATIPIATSWLIFLFASSLKEIIIGRIILGVSLGSGSCAYAYVAEVCPAANRPFYLSVVNVFVGSGMLCEFLLAMFFQWQTASGILFAASVVSCLSLFFLPETPMWLRSQDRVFEAKDAERWLRVDPPAVVTSPTDNDDTGDRNPGRLWTMLAQPNVWKPALLTVAFFVCQHGTGVYVLLFYSVNILKDFRVTWDGVTAATFLAVSRVLGSLVFSALYLVKRKTLTVVSSTGMAVSLAVVIAYWKTYEHVTNPPHGNVPVVAFVAYVFFAMLAILPIPWTICGEVFPTAVKGKMIGVVQICGYELMFLVIKLYPILVSKFGIVFIWSVFIGFCILTALYGIFLMPETKGKTLDEILMSFESRN